MGRRSRDRFGLEVNIFGVSEFQDGKGNYTIPQRELMQALNVGFPVSISSELLFHPGLETRVFIPRDMGFGLSTLDLSSGSGFWILVL